jgi:Mrp family chromosome partitioning ATPase
VEIAAEQNPPVIVTVGQVVNGTTVDGSSSSDIVKMSYSATTQREAITVVNAVAVAYQEIGRLSADDAFDSAVVELDLSISELRREIDEIEDSLSLRQEAVLDSLSSDPGRAIKTLLLADLVAELLALEPPPILATDQTVTRFNNELQLLSLRVATITNELANERTVVLAIERDDPDRAALNRLQGEAQQRLAELQARHDQLAVDADLSGNGVIFYSPAETAASSSSSLYIVLGFLSGLAVGSGLAVLLTSRRRRFSSRNEPETFVGARLLADVPNFKDERVDSTLPVIDAPTSASAEAFRFVSASIALQQKWPTNDDGSKNFKSLVTLSAGLFEGKTVVTANTALAAAREGHKVLVVDADFGNQQLTELLLGSTMPLVGMTDVTDGRVTLKNAVIDVPHDGSGSVHLLARGTVSVQAPDFFAAQGTVALFSSLAKIYDLVLIDSPPLLRVAYATTLARLADRAMVVVAHGEDTHAAEELRDQMELVGIPPIGYVYNFAPLRAEMTASVGSMADTLGENSATTHEVVLRQE